MTELYSFEGAEPAPIPFRIVMPDGFTRTNPETFTPDEIAAAGYVEAPAAPSYDPLIEREPRWIGGLWQVDPIPVSEIAEREATERAALIASYGTVATEVMDAKARERGYDNIATGVTWREVGDAQFSAEGGALCSWRTCVWRHVADVTAAVLAGEVEPPSVAEFVVNLPSFAWPETA